MAVERAARLATGGGIQQVEPVHLIMRKNNSVRFAQILAISLVISGGQVPAAESVDAGWKAGVAKAKITPEQPLWLSGYGSRDRPSEGTRVDLWVKALALQDSRGHQALLITLDLVGIDHVGFAGDFTDSIERVKLGEMLPGTSYGTSAKAAPTQGAGWAYWRVKRPDMLGTLEERDVVPYAKGIDNLSKLPDLTRGLIARGYDDESITKILGKNWLRVLDIVAGLK